MNWDAFEWNIWRIGRLFVIALIVLFLFKALKPAWMHVYRGSWVQKTWDTVLREGSKAWHNVLAPESDTSTTADAKEALRKESEGELMIKQAKLDAEAVQAKADEAERIARTLTDPPKAWEVVLVKVLHNGTPVEAEVSIERPDGSIMSDHYHPGSFVSFYPRKDRTYHVNARRVGGTFWGVEQPVRLTKGDQYLKVYLQVP